MKEPLWRQFLCWGAVGLFVLFPLLVFFLRLVSEQLPGFDFDVEKYRYMIPYFQTLTGLVFGLAGLNSWDKRNGQKPPKE